MSNDPFTHYCAGYPSSSCAWCERAHLVARCGWRDVHDGHYDVVPLAKLPIEMMDKFLDFFDCIVRDKSETAITERGKKEVADLYVIAGLFIAEMERREADRELERACGPGWMATQ